MAHRSAAASRSTSCHRRVRPRWRYGSTSRNRARARARARARGSWLRRLRVVGVEAGAARCAVALEICLLDAFWIEAECTGVLGEKPAHVDRRRQLAEHLAFERLEVRHADLRALGDLAQLDADRFA